MSGSSYRTWPKEAGTLARWIRRCRSPGTRIPRSCGARRSGSSARAWQYVGHTGQLATPGYFAAKAGRTPVVVTRDRDGVVRGFVNVCRHRGSALAEGEASRETLQCPYHAWTYGLDGSLRAAPRSDEEPDFPQDELGLVPVAVDTWGPFVFANADPDAGAARAGARLAARAGRGARAGRRLARPPLPLGGRDRGELEDRERELPRVLPLPGRASRLQRARRRLARGVRALDGRAPLDPARPAADGDARATSCSARSSTSSGRTSGSTSSPAARTSRSGRSSRSRPTGRTASSTTSSAPRSSPPGSTTSSPSTTRSDGRTARSSRACSAASPRARSSAACS